MADKVIAVTVRDVYGVRKAYPANEPAKILAEIAGTKTLMRETLDLAEKLGFAIEVRNVETLEGVA